MKKLVFLAIFLIGFGLTVFSAGKKTPTVEPAGQSRRQEASPLAGSPLGGAQASVASNITLGPAKTSLFVPYWSLSESNTPFSSPAGINRPIDTAIYFSVSATASGINKSNTGFSNIEEFVNRAADTPHNLLTVSMVDDAINDLVLQDNNAQNAIISQAAEIAEDNGFDGIILDLEVGGIAATKVNTQIITFVKTASEISKKNKLSFAMTLYGDSFYRSRPYSIELLSPYVDQFYIMAYDMSKLWGTPGPNFPLKGRDIFGYDMQTMISDMMKFTTRNKLTVIFGLYGHDWTVDEKKRPFTAAKTLTFSQIKENFIDSCEWNNCLIKRNPYAAETEINYIDKEAHYHIAWYEDTESIAQKIGFLKESGINSVSYWAYSYY